MHLIYLQQAGKPVEGTSGDFWVLAGAALPVAQWKELQVRVNGLQRSFFKDNYNPVTSELNANDLLHPRRAETRFSQAISKGFEKIASALDIKLFLVVIDKRTTDKPAHPRWLLPLSYHYLMKPICQYLSERDSYGALVIPPGRTDEAEVISTVQVEHLFGPTGRHSPLISSPMVQPAASACGLQIADFVATTAKRYQETVYPKLYAKEILYGYDAIINSHYQGFVKPNTFSSDAVDEKGFKVRGYIYLWRRDHRHNGGRPENGAHHEHGGETTEAPEKAATPAAAEA